MLSEIFYSLLITTGGGLILSLAKLCFKSKCSEVNLCCLKIIRDVDAEEKEAEFIATHTTRQSPTNEKNDINKDSDSDKS